MPEAAKIFTEEIIYVHPYTPFSNQLEHIPMSLPALINRLPYKIKGFFAEELADKTIRKTKIVIIDLHWFLSLYGAYILCKHIKKVNKNAIIIAGGITASEFYRILIEKFNIDFIIRGDAEIPLRALVYNLMNDLDLNQVPNIAGKDNFSTNWDYCLNQKDLDENNYMDIDFFPSFRSFVYGIHNSGNGMMIPSIMYPCMMVVRGCPRIYKCSYCAGGMHDQFCLFRRENLTRSSTRVNDDLTELENNSNIKFVYFTQDLINLYQEEDIDIVLNKKFQLKAGLELFNIPKYQNLEKFLNAFEGGTIGFCLAIHYSQNDDIGDIALLIDLIRLVKNKNYFPVLFYSERFSKTNMRYRDSLKTIVTATDCKLLEISRWWINYPLPLPDGTADEKYFGYFLYESYMQERNFNKDNYSIKMNYRFKIKKDFYLLKNYNNINKLLKKLNIECIRPESEI